MSATLPFTLILSGGGMKGLAHIGVLSALEERGLVPSLLVGSSMGAMVAATWATGMPLADMRERALRLRRRDIFQVAHIDMALKRMLSPAVYRTEPLESIAEEIVGDRTFRDLPRRLLVNTVDLNSGAQVLWGLPGLDDVPVRDAVFASCALPGIFAPREIRGRYYVDGAVTENLPVRLAARAGIGPVLASNVSATAMERPDVQNQGFAATYIRGLETVMKTQIETDLKGWKQPPLVLIEPQVQDISMFAFDRTAELLEEGRRATVAVLDALGTTLDCLEGGIHPKRRIHVAVDRARCVGCGTCALWAPDVFRMTEDGKAEVLRPLHVWSPADGTYEQRCPTHAIRVTESEELIA